MGQLVSCAREIPQSIIEGDRLDMIPQEIDMGPEPQEKCTLINPFASQRTMEPGCSIENLATHLGMFDHFHDPRRYPIEKSIFFKCTDGIVKYQNGKFWHYP